ncbi:MAG: right-handed parallel beta-helix repeat-containing protein, partial [Treponema sp.]|nr:right-handed parallel beta-helix repeat-containing protein [Treponema sp.]
VPANQTERDKTFILRAGVEVRGGYPASGGADSTRDVTLATNKTILSGDIGVSGDTSDNAYHVVISFNIPNADGKTILDGFEISGGNGDGRSLAPLIDSKTFMRSSGGGIFNNNASPTLRNLIIANNFIDGAYGAGMRNEAASPIIVNVIISGNKAEGSASGSTIDVGGGMYNSAASPVLINVIFTGNFVKGGSGGGMYNTASKTDSTNTATICAPVLINATIAGNYANGAVGGGIYNTGSNTTVKVFNSIIWGNSGTASVSNNSSSKAEFTNSIVQGSGGSSSWNAAYGTDKGGNKNADPLFEDLQQATSTPTIAGDYSLKSESPAIGAGSNDLYPNTWAKWAAMFTSPATSPISEAVYNQYVLPHLVKDLAGNTRIQKGTIDMGAYESSYDTPVTVPPNHADGWLTDIVDETAAGTQGMIAYQGKVYGWDAVNNQIAVWDEITEQKRYVSAGDKFQNNSHTYFSSTGDYLILIPWQTSNTQIGVFNTVTQQFESSRTAPASLGNLRQQVTQVEGYAYWADYSSSSTAKKLHRYNLSEDTETNYQIFTEFSCEGYWYNPDTKKLYLHDGGIGGNDNYKVIEFDTQTLTKTRDIVFTTHTYNRDIKVVGEILYLSQNDQSLVQTYDLSTNTQGESFNKNVQDTLRGIKGIYSNYYFSSGPISNGAMKFFDLGTKTISASYPYTGALSGNNDGNSPCYSELTNILYFPMTTSLSLARFKVPEAYR